MMKSIATIGVMGGGQLALMLAEAALLLNVRVTCFVSSTDCPAAAVCECVVGDEKDIIAIQHFIESVDVVTFESENVDVLILKELSQVLQEKIRPSIHAIEITQDRFIEKTFLRTLGIPTAIFHPVNTVSELAFSIEMLGFPIRLKTNRMGYDGKGQWVISDAEDLHAFWKTLPAIQTTPKFIAEGQVHFQRELSLIAVRNAKGEMAFYPLTENKHEEGILRISKAPFINPKLQEISERYAAALLDALHYVGVLVIEFFDVKGNLYVNELAPRVHNSGHWTIEGAVTSQFEQHIRAILGWPLASTHILGKAVMTNIIGEIPADIDELPENAYVHLYGKSPRPGRKLGHITTLIADENT